MVNIETLFMATEPMTPAVRLKVCECLLFALVFVIMAFFAIVAADIHHYFHRHDSDKEPDKDSNGNGDV